VKKEQSRQRDMEPELDMWRSLFPIAINMAELK